MPENEEAPPIYKYSREETQKWGYDMFPARRSDAEPKVNVANMIFSYLPESRGHKRRCEENVYKVFSKSI